MQLPHLHRLPSSCGGRGRAYNSLSVALALLLVSVGGLASCRSTSSTADAPAVRAADAGAQTDGSAAGSDTPPGERGNDAPARVGGAAGDKPGDKPPHPVGPRAQPLPCEVSPDPVLPAKGLGDRADVPQCGPQPMAIKRCGGCFGGSSVVPRLGFKSEVCVDPGDKLSLKVALAKAANHTTICVRAGVHKVPTDGLRLTDVEGVQVIGQPGAIISGEANAVAGLGVPWPPRHEDFVSAGEDAWRKQTCLRLKDVKDVAVRRLQFRGCISKGVEVINSEQVWLDQLDFERGWKAIVLRRKTVEVSGPTPTKSDVVVRNVVVSHSRWQQDMSAERHLWCGGCGLTWGNVHTANNNETELPTVIPGSCAGFANITPAFHHPGRYEHLDGAFVVAADVAGDVRICRNHVRDAYNGVIFQVSPTVWTALQAVFQQLPPAHPGQIEFSRNVQIHHNTFIRIRDNIFEPEKWMWNWEVHHNVLFNFYKPFSFQWVGGGQSKIFNNVGFNDGHDIGGARQCVDGSGVGAHDVSAVFKFPDHNEAFGAALEMFSHPVWIFHNTWLHAGDVVARTLKARHLKHCNNRVLWRRGADQPPSATCASSAETRRSLPVAFHAKVANPPGGGDSSGWHHESWSMSQDATNIFFPAPTPGQSQPPWMQPPNAPVAPLQGFGTWPALEAATAAAWAGRVHDVAPAGVVSSLGALAPPAGLTSVSTTSCAGFAGLPGGQVKGQLMGALNTAGGSQTLEPVIGTAKPPK